MYVTRVCVGVYGTGIETNRRKIVYCEAAAYASIAANPKVF